MAYIGVQVTKTGFIDLVDGSCHTPLKHNVFWPPYKITKVFSTAVTNVWEPNQATFRLFYYSFECLWLVCFANIGDYKLLRLFYCLSWKDIFFGNLSLNTRVQWKSEKKFGTCEEISFRLLNKNTLKWGTEIISDESECRMQEIGSFKFLPWPPSFQTFFW